MRVAEEWWRRGLRDGSQGWLSGTLGRWQDQDGR